ncbi:hypothetical protein IP83_10330 [Novosphingobium sp. AAP93]|nr:hypothetical protein IP83_10330 [Novosphingobium sp. AAP93]
MGRGFRGLTKESGDGEGERAIVESAGAESGGRVGQDQAAERALAVEGGAMGEGPSERRAAVRGDKRNVERGKTGAWGKFGHRHDEHQHQRLRGEGGAGAEG